ncbi:MAG: hypothetical protein JNL94_06775, partial [Planctomycetes bacterium]|nr:hypothetical protein [Planctomycetota bacterium]
MNSIVAGALCAFAWSAIAADSTATPPARAELPLPRIEPFFVASGDADGSLLGMFARMPIR